MLTKKGNQESAVLEVQMLDIDLKTRSMDTLGYLLKLPRFEYITPGSVEEAFGLMDRFSGRFVLLSGGTYVVRAMKRRELRPKYLISVRMIDGFDCVRVWDNRVCLGPHVSLSRVSRAEGGFIFPSYPC